MAEITVPMVTVYMRKAFGMAVDATSNLDRLHLRVVWPTVEWGSMPVEGGVAAAHRREIEAAPNPEMRRAEIEGRLLEKAYPWKIAEDFGLEEMLDPTETREYIYNFIDAAQVSIRSSLGPKPRFGPRL